MGNPSILPKSKRIVADCSVKIGSWKIDSEAVRVHPADIDEMMILVSGVQRRAWFGISLCDSEKRVMADGQV